MRVSNSTCVTVTQKTQCYNKSVEAAKTVNTVSTLDTDNTCKYVLTGGECYDYTAEVSKNVSASTHINSDSNCVQLADTECFGENVAVTTTASAHRNVATGLCVNLSATQCFADDAAVDLSSTNSAKADGTCLTLKDNECEENDAVKVVSNTKVKKASNSKCVNLTAGNCWNASTETQDATSASNHLHSTTGHCVPLLKTECFKSDEASPNSATQARKTDGTCVELQSSECWDGAAAKATSDVAPLVFKAKSNSNCVDVSDAQC